MPRTKLFATLSLATTLFVPSAFAQNTISARPGTINYIEGQATLNGEPLVTNSTSHLEMAQGQTLATTSGKVEVLLTPGVFLRLGTDSSVNMVSPDLTKTEVQLIQGRAEVEVDQIYKQNDLLVDDGSAQAKLLEHGLYEFDASNGNLRVFEGKAAVSPSQTAEKWITVKGGHELTMNSSAQKANGFDREQAARQDPLYAWSNLRAQYLNQANKSLAQEEGSRRDDSGWFWNPAAFSYTWLPGEGLFWSPFGYGFYSPYYLSRGGFYPGYGFGYGGFRYGGGGIYRGGYTGGSQIYRGGMAGGGFHGGGGFHSGGGRR